MQIRSNFSSGFLEENIKTISPPNRFLPSVSNLYSTSSTDTSASQTDSDAKNLMIIEPEDDPLILDIFNTFLTFGTYSILV